MYKGETEAEMLTEMAKATGCRLIYKYANDFGDKAAHTDYMVIMAPGDAQEQGLINSPFIHNLTLVFRDGEMVNEKV
jgi:lactate dehydrogenase-like 2-hydroxyacid dehydrogenase